MKRTPPLLALSAVAVQLAALGLCAWVMSWHSHVADDDLFGSPGAPERDAPAPHPAAAESDPPAPVPEREHRAEWPTFAPHVEPAAGPRLVAPPPGAGETPGYILELAERTTQVVRGHVEGSWLTFGFYPDGNVRMVDVDGGRYEGRAVSARAEMREAVGNRSFLLQIGVAPDGRLQATFRGGLHDAQTIVLEPLVERPVA